MYWQRPFIHGVPRNDGVAAQDLTATFAVADLTAWLVDGHSHHAVRDPRGALWGQPDVVRTDLVFCGLRVITDRVGDAVVVRVIGEVDARSAPGLAIALQASWETTCPPGPLVVDLTGTVFISVAGLALLVTTEQQCRERGLLLRVGATTRGVLRALRVTGLDVLFDITTTRVAAKPRAYPEWTVRKRL